MIPALIIVLLFAIVMAAILPALLNRSQTAHSNRESTNASIAIDRMQEIRNISDQDRTEAEDEIKSSLLEDTRAEETAATQTIPFRYSLWIPIFLIGLSAGLYVQLGNPSLMFDSSQTLRHSTTDNTPSIDVMIRQLEEKIKQEPNNIEALQIAGQVYSSIGDTVKAEWTYRKLNDLSPGNPDYLAGLANVVILNNNDTYINEAETLVQQALTIDPQHQNALWISALGASSRGEIEQSIGQLEKLLSIVQDEDEVRQSLLSMIEQQRALLDNESAIEQKGKGKTLVIEVALDENISEQASKTDTVFLTAKAANGPPAPLAVRKLAAGDLPQTVSLTQAHSMISGMTIDHFDEIIVQARVSLNGTVQTHRGDLVSDSMLVAGEPDKPLSLVINQVLD